MFPDCLLKDSEANWKMNHLRTFVYIPSSDTFDHAEKRLNQCPLLIQFPVSGIT